MKKAVVAVLLSLCIMSSVSFADNYDYGKVQSASLYLYDANMCGENVSDKSLIDWRENCHSDDLLLPLDTLHTDLTQSFINNNRNILDSDNDGKIDVSGGFHDAGDYVKFGLPQMYTAVTLQWALYEFKDSFKYNNDMPHFNTILGYFNDYIKKCTFINNDGQVVAFCYQVGDGKSDHDYWGSPENQTTERPAYFATTDNPATDITALASAAMAADYVNSGNIDSLNYAKALYNFTNDSSVKAVGDDHAPSGDEYYKSENYEDDIAFASAWLYIATGDNNYLTTAQKYLDSAIYDVPYWIYCWDDTWLGGMALIAEKTGNIDYKNAIKETLDIWQKNYNSPQGYACIDKWGSARYNTNAQFLALVYAKHYGDMSYANWAKSQMDYLLGDNKDNICYVTGISDNSVKYPHHAAASGLSSPDDKSPHKHILYGALVGGPDKKDKHKDLTNDYQYNEVSLDYNAGLVAASAGIYEFFGDKKIKEDTTETITENSTEMTTETITIEMPDLLGDANLNGRIETEDVACILQKTLLDTFKMPCENKYGSDFIVLTDVSGDGKINSQDAAMILQKALDSTFQFPVEK